MKNFYLKLNLVLLFVVVNITAFAQYTPSNLETGKQNTALAKDASGNIYTTRVQSAGLYEIVKYTNDVAVTPAVKSGIVGGGFDLPYGLAVASNGDIYYTTSFANNSTGSIKRLAAANGYAETEVQTGRYFTGLAFDNQNRLYALELRAGSYAVVRYNTPSTVNSTGDILNNTISNASGLSLPTSISVATDLTIYCNNVFDVDGSNPNKGGIIKLTTSNNGTSYTKSDLNTTNYTSALFIDEFNNLYAIESVSDGPYKLYKYINGAGAPAEFYSAAFSAGYPNLAFGVTAHNNTVYAIDGDNGSSGSRLLKLTPQDLTPPAVPTGLIAPTFTGGSKVNLSWNANSETDFNGYRIYYGTTNNPASLTTYVSVAKGTTSTQITGLTAGTTYYFVISSLDNNFNESAKSSSVTITPQKPIITSATYVANSKVLTVTGTNFFALTGTNNDISISKLTLTGEGNINRVLSSSDVEIASATSFSVTLNSADQAIINPIINKNGNTSTGGATYNLAVATGWLAGEDVSVNTAQATIALTVSNVPVPTITSATYNGQTGILVVTGTNLYRLTGATNDIDPTKFTFRGQSGNTYALQNTTGVEISSSTSFTLTLSASDKFSLSSVLNNNGTSSADATVYNLVAANTWNRGADPLTNTEDLVGNGITVSNFINYVLPIELIDFSHKINNNEVVLNWSTSSEVNNKEYRLSRSLNGTDFTPLATIAGAGNSSIALNYTYTDKKPLLGTSYYKLTQVDNDNIIKLEKTIPVNFSVSGLAVLVYPNPVSESFSIQNNANRYTKATLSDLSGKIVGRYNLSADVTTINISTLPKGVYMLNLSSNSGKVVKKIVKN